jgi:recombination protein RecR
MDNLAAPMSRLVEELKRLPGIGDKSAQRMAFYLLGVPTEDAQRLAHSIVEMRTQIQLCDHCNNLSENSLCDFCTSSERDPKVICVVEQPNNIITVERTRQYRGQYHVLHGALSPLRNVGPENLLLTNLMKRLAEGTVEEVILATSPTSEGQATATYLARLLKPLGVRVSRIGMGIPIGTELDYVDEATMMEAMDGRREL